MKEWGVVKNNGSWVEQMPICHIIAILESEKDCEEIRHAPQLLYVLREQNRDLKEPLYDCCHEGLLWWYSIS